jgi:hypothetical protein
MEGKVVFSFERFARIFISFFKYQREEKEVKVLEKEEPREIEKLLRKKFRELKTSNLKIRKEM